MTNRSRGWLSPSRIALAAVLFSFTMLAAGAWAADEPAAAGPAPAGASAAAAPAPAPPATGPVPVPVPSEKAMRYYRSGNVLWAGLTIWGFLVPLAWVATGASARLRSFAGRIARGRWYATVTVYFVFFIVLGTLIDLPLSYYADFVRPHAYGLSNQTLAKWTSDGAKGMVVSIVIAALFAWVPFWLLRKSPRRWWLWTAALSFPFIVLLVLVTPIWIDPLFNKFGPMKDKALEADLLAEAGRAGIEGARVFEVEKSVDTETVNAYVTGFGGTKRIVLWDTILKKLDREQVLYAMGHEMGHYVLGHVWRTLALLPLLVLAGLWLIHRTSGALLARFGGRFGFSELADVAATPWLGLLFGVFIFLVSPLVLAYSRGQEHEADRFGLELTHDNHAAASAFVRLQEENLANPRPGPLYKLWRSSHPPLGERIDFCNTYRPWETGEPQRYADRFRTGR
jgi:Zn-dependent protease with chaperone function